MFIHLGAVRKQIQTIQVDGGKPLRKYCVVEAPLRYAPDQRHLSALKTQTQTTTRTGFLTFMAFS
jgi:hypothetical protein